MKVTFGIGALPGFRGETHVRHAGTHYAANQLDECFWTVDSCLQRTINHKSDLLHLET
jgi:hypothetical protein